MRQTLLFLGVALFVAAHASYAGIISSSRVNALDLPSDATQVGANGITSNTSAFAFDEAAGISVGANELAVDFLAGTNLGSDDTVSLWDTLLSPDLFLDAGVYESHLILSDHHRPRGRGPVRYQGSVAFDSPIVALIISGDNLAASSQFELAGLDYNYHGLDYILPDRLTTGTFFISGDSLSWDFWTYGAWDEVRVLTRSGSFAAIPEPGQVVAGIAGGLMALLFFRRFAQEK